MNDVTKTCLLLLFGLLAKPALAEPPIVLLQGLDTSPHMSQVTYATTSVIDHEVGLGAMKKVRGTWQFRDSERLTGELTRYT